MSISNPAPGSEWTPARISSVTKVVIAILAAGIMLGLFATGANLYYVGAGIAAAALAILVAWQFEAALIVYILVAFVPWGRTPALGVGGSGVGRGLYVSEVVLGFLLVVWAAKYMLSAIPHGRVRSGFHIPMIAYIIYSVINVLHSYIFWDPHVSRDYQYLQVNLVEIGLRILSIGAFLMVATSITNAKWLRWATLGILLPGLYNLFNDLAGGPIPVAAPWWPLLTILPAGYCWAVCLDPGANTAKRVVAAMVVAVAVGVIFVNSVFWVSGWFGLFTSLGVVTWIGNRKAAKSLIGAAALLVIVFWPFINHNVFVTSRQEGDFDRFALLSGAAKYATTFPLGVGLGNYRSYNSFYYGEKWGTTSYTSAHGTYSQHLSEMGVPGLIMLLSVLVFGFKWIRMNYRHVSDTQAKTYLLATMGQIAGVSAAAFIGDYIIPTYHNGGIVTFSTAVYSWLAWGLAVAHVRIHGTEAYGPISSNRKLEHSKVARPLPLVRV